MSLHGNTRRYTVSSHNARCYCASLPWTQTCFCYITLVICEHAADYKWHRRSIRFGPWPWDLRIPIMLVALEALPWRSFLDPWPFRLSFGPGTCALPAPDGTSMLWLWIEYTLPAPQRRGRRHLGTSPFYPATLPVAARQLAC